MKRALRAFERDVVACRRCPRLVEFREGVAGTKRAYRDEPYWSKPVPGFGDPDARIVVVGLAPAPHGANRTGRMFTGDGTDLFGSSEFLTRTLHRTGFANIPTSRTADDGLVLTDIWLTAIVRCAPPGNKPVRDEILTCGSWLVDEFALFPRARCVVALGKLAFDQLLRLFAEAGAELPRPRPRFAHGVEFDAGPPHPLLLGSYHPSRQNTQTGRLREERLAEVFERAREVVA